MAAIVAAPSYGKANLILDVGLAPNEYRPFNAWTSAYLLACLLAEAGPSG